MMWVFSFFLLNCGEKGEQVSTTESLELPKSDEYFQTMSLLGDSLYAEIDSVAQEKQLINLEEAISAYSSDPSLYNYIWKGRREAYLGLHQQAVQTYTEALEQFPEGYQLLRHRGHRYITLREFDEAIADFNKAAELMKDQPLEVEEDGIPNRLNIPLSTVQFNVWYHLGLAHYLKGEYELALKAYQNCLEVSDNDDLVVATVDWYYMTLQKLGKGEQAMELLQMVKPEMEIIENDAYFKRISLYKGELEPNGLLNTAANEADQQLQFVTQGYGLGNYYLEKGQEEKAMEIFQKVLDTGYWSAFGYIASEVALQKLKDGKRGV